MAEPSITVEVRCACPTRDEYDCWTRRYPPPVFDAMGFPAAPPARHEIEADGGPCACACHVFWDGALEEED